MRALLISGTPVTGRPSAWRVTTSLIVSCCALIACAGNADRARRGDSTAAAVATATDDFDTSAPRASDATLVIQTAAHIREALRAVTDSFAAREAIRVAFAPGLDSTGAGTSLPLSPTADLVVITGQQVPHLPHDSASWTLPFAESRVVVPQPVALTDIGARADTARATRPRSRDRNATGRRADSIRADSVRRATERMRMDSVRMDSVRTLVLTIPLDAPNSSVAERFVRYLLTDGRATLLRSGVHVLPRLVLRGDGAPSGVRAVVDTVIPGDSIGSAGAPFAR